MVQASEWVGARPGSAAQLRKVLTTTTPTGTAVSTFALLTPAVFSGGLVVRINLASTVSMTVASSSDSIATLRLERMKRETSARAAVDPVWLRMLLSELRRLLVPVKWFVSRWRKLFFVWPM